ncbi:MAG: hypothetical protein SF069_08335 [Phycisphaerae bacterium]|nr:hypothetical protein [Phycisphaerae bacterium]
MTDDDLKQAMELLPNDRAREDVLEALRPNTKFRAAPVAYLSGFAVGMLAWAFHSILVWALNLASNSYLRILSGSVPIILGMLTIEIVASRRQRKRMLRRYAQRLADYGVIACANCGYLDRRPPGEPRRCSECGAALPAARSSS